MPDTSPNPAEPPVADIAPSLPEEPTPMLDVHPAHHAASTWKEFFIHIATIVLGLCIAVGLEQGVEHIHHRRELAEARRELAIERKINIVRFSVETQEFHRFVPILENNLALFIYLRRHPGKPVPLSLGTLRWHLMSYPMVDSAWTAAQHSGVVDYMPQAEARKNDELYHRLNALTAAIHDARFADTECWRFRIADPDPARLSPAQLDQEIDLVSRALFAHRTMANVMTNLHGTFPDFTPAPSVSDYQAITHSQTPSADDQHDIDATHAEVKTVTDYERALDQNDAPE